MSLFVGKNIPPFSYVYTISYLCLRLTLSFTHWDSISGIVTRMIDVWELVGIDYLANKS